MFDSLPWVTTGDSDASTNSTTVDTDADRGPPNKHTDAAAPTGPATASPYDITERSSRRIDGRDVLARTEAEGVVAGQHVREMFEAATASAEPPLWVGYSDDLHRGFREASFPFDSLFRHLWVTGTTGYGKTTALLNTMVQWAYAGYGFVYVDPKGEDSRALLRKLPENRLEDVVWIEPGAEHTDRTVGLNFLDLPPCDSQARRENEIESRVENLTAVFDSEEYWGINMESITESMGRAMLQSDTDFSVIDMYFVLANADRRESFADEVEDPYVREFCGEIARMDDEVVRPLLKRMKAWVENAVIRTIIAHRESTIDFGDIVANDRIVVVRTPVENTDIKQLITLGVLRNVWSAIQRRAHRTSGTPDPFFVLCDEFDEIASKNLDVEAMLARARSMRLGVTIATQYPAQLEESTLQAVQNNCDNLLAFSVNDVEDARVLMKRFEGYEPADLISTDQYRAWTKLPLEGGRYSRPVLLDTFPPYPPLRSEDAADAVVERSLDRYGTEVPTDDAILRELVYGGDIGFDRNDESMIAEAMAAAVRAVQFRANARPDNGWVPIDDVEAECRHRLDEHHSDLAYGPEDLPAARDATDLLETEFDAEAETIVVRLTDRGETAVDTDLGVPAVAGGPTHQALLRETDEHLSRLGFSVTILEQDGSNIPDGVATHPDAEQPFAIEAETTTPDRPAKVLQNLKRAQEDDRTPLFVVEEGETTPTKWARRVENVCTEPHRPLEDGRVRFYNRDEIVTFGGGATTRGGVTAVRPHSSDSRRTVWTVEDDDLLLSDGEDDHARLPADAAISKDVLPAYYSYDPETERYTVYAEGETTIYDDAAAFEADWVPIKRPFRPDRALPDPSNPREQFLVLVLTDDEGPLLYRDGEIYTPQQYPAAQDPWPLAAATADRSEASTDEAPTQEPPPDVDLSDGGVAAFADRFVREVDDGRVPKDAAFERYQRWAERVGADATNKVWFGRRLTDAVDCEDKRVREDGDRINVYDGIELTTHPMEDPLR